MQRCSKCEQLFSQCDEQYYKSTMEEFNTPEGTWPTEDATSSLIRGTKKVVSRIERLLRLESQKTHLLDVGCSNGAFIYQAQKLGVNAEGVEPAEQAAQAAQLAGLNVYHGFLEELALQKEKYDVITLFEVIEHVKNPLPLVNECYRLLKKDGLLVIRTANTKSWTVQVLRGKWHYFDMAKHGGHISFYNKKSIEALAEKTRFSIERFYTHSVSYSEKRTRGNSLYKALRILSELSNLPAKLTGNGQEMEVFLKKM